jgi:PKD repeat protein
MICSMNLRAQLFIDTSYTVDQMIHGFFDNSGVSISNVTYTGSPMSMGFFEGSQSNIGLNAGLLVTTGSALLAVGPNTIPNAGVSMGLPGTSWLDALIPGYYTHDASIIEMDVVPVSDTLSFRYVFASEEYKEYVNTQFNDLFAFFMQGPGLPASDSMWVKADTVYQTNYNACLICVDTLITIPTTYCYYDTLKMQDTCIIVYVDSLTQWCYQDPNCIPPVDTTIYPGYWTFSPGGVNIAMVPGTNLPVSINNVNQFVNTQYFVENDSSGLTVQYDAFTKPLWANVVVQHGKTYHVRVAIADAGDGIYDSGVFLSIQSLGSDSLLPVIPHFSMAVPSGNNTIEFHNTSFWGTKNHWDFGDGTTSDEKNPVHVFAQSGVYQVSLTVSNWCSSKTYTLQATAGLTNTSDVASEVFQALPNPTNGLFTLHLKHAFDADVRITGLDGRILMEDHLSDGAKVDLNRFGKGMYLIQVVSDGKTYTAKMVNQ